MYDIKWHIQRNHPDIDLNATSFSFIESITDLSIKSLLLELKQGLQGEIAVNENETDEQHILTSKSNLTSECSFTSESSLTFKCTATSCKELQASAFENTTIIETVNKGMENV
jgi:hypothetical protein